MSALRDAGFQCWRLPLGFPVAGAASRALECKASRFKDRRSKQGSTKACSVEAHAVTGAMTFEIGAEAAQTL